MLEKITGLLENSGNVRRVFMEPADLMKPCVILVQPTQDGNIGSTARAMANFGLTKLRLVDPPDKWDTLFCRQMASGANHVLNAVEVFSSTQDAIADLQKIYATTARRRDMVKPILTAGQAGKETAALGKNGILTGFLFGTEKSGLTNEDIVRSDAAVYINLSPDHPSLNLAQAVLLVAYEWYQNISRPLPDSILHTGKLDMASQEDIEGFFGHLEAELDASNYWRVASKKPEMLSSLRNIFKRSSLTSQETRSLRGVLQALVYHRWQEVIDPGTKKPRSR